MRCCILALLGGYAITPVGFPSGASQHPPRAPGGPGKEDGYSGQGECDGPLDSLFPGTLVGWHSLGAFRRQLRLSQGTTGSAASPHPAPSCLAGTHPQPLAGILASSPSPASAHNPLHTPPPTHIRRLFTFFPWTLRQASLKTPWPS